MTEPYYRGLTAAPKLIFPLAVVAVLAAAIQACDGAGFYGSSQAASLVTMEDAGDIPAQVDTSQLTLVFPATNMPSGFSDETDVVFQVIKPEAFQTEARVEVTDEIVLVMVDVPTGQSLSISITFAETGEFHAIVDPLTEDTPPFSGLTLGGDTQFLHSSQL